MVEEKLPKASILWPEGPGPLTIARLYFVSVTLLTAPAIVQLFETGAMSGRAIGTYSLQWLLLLGVALLVGLALLVVTVLLFTPQAARLARLGAWLTARLPGGRWLEVLGLLATLALYVAVVLWRFDRHFIAEYPRAWLFWLAVGVGALFMRSGWKQLPAMWALLITAVMYGFGIKALSYLPSINAYPFSLTWSEASRYYYASLPFAEKLYGMPIPLSPWHPSRYLMMGLLFLIPDAPLWLHRAWQVFLWLGMSLATGYFILRRFQGLRWPALLAGSVWGALFLLQGPVYYHLLICVILVLAGFDRERFWKTMLFVGLASVWAGLSRVNWFPVPAFLAVALYLMEKPFRGSRNWLAYLAAPAIWGVAGMSLALAAKAAYVLVSGHEDISGFGSTFTSALLWYRLLPNPTYRWGVFPAILIISAPALLFVGVSIWRGRAHWHVLRLLGLGAMGLVLLVGGLVVSTKIGGGSNVHNMDAFMAFLLVVTVSLWLGGFASEQAGRAPAWRNWVLALLLLALPVVWDFRPERPFQTHDMQQAAADVDWLREFVTVHAQGGEVLFISQRQLLLFGEIEGVKLTPEYEMLTLSEMAISNNQVYLEQFRQDLANRRFNVIVANMQNEVLKDAVESSFAEENNAWVENITVYIRNYYETAFTLPAPGVEIFLPTDP